MNFKEAYKFPLHADDFFPIKAWTADNQNAFDMSRNVTIVGLQNLCSTINGETEYEGRHTFHYEDGKVFDENGKPLLRLRGWGYLTGSGGLNLSPNEAIQIQDDFGNYITQRLNHEI